MKITRLITLAVVILTAVLSLSPAFVFAQPCPGANTPEEAIRCGTDDAANQSGGTPVRTLDDTITNIVDIMSIIVGVIAVIMIIVGGFRYITSGGDTTKIGSAKNTLLYAIVGLIVVALSQIIARFVINAFD